MNKKTFLKIGLALVVAFGLFFAVKTFFPTQTEVGEKTVQITVLVQQDDGSMEKIFDQSVKTDSEYLAGLLTELNENNILSVTLSGEATDPYGRSLIAINDIETTNWETGPWWLYNSDNNTDCVAAGYCSGIDSCPIYDGDNFVFSYTSTY